MSISAFDLFTIGIGPSSSHTIGPMRAAKAFVDDLNKSQQIAKVARLKTELYGSLGATGKGHGSDKAVILGLLGETPEMVDVDSVAERVKDIRESRNILLNGSHLVLSLIHI